MNLLFTRRSETIWQTPDREPPRQKRAEMFAVVVKSLGNKREQVGQVLRRIRSPLWRGGGRVHGPQPSDWSYKMPKKMRRGALRSALSERFREGNIIIIDDFKIDNPKTKDFISVLTTLGFAG